MTATVRLTLGNNHHGNGCHGNHHHSNSTRRGSPHQSEVIEWGWRAVSLLGVSIREGVVVTRRLETSQRELQKIRAEYTLVTSQWRNFEEKVKRTKEAVQKLEEEFDCRS